MALRHLPRRPLPPLLRSSPRRAPPPLNSSQPTSRYSSSTSTSTTTTPRTKLNRILTRLPRFLHPYTTALLTAPISHLTSFLILHEITAIVPLVGLATTFHYAGWLPETWVKGRWVNEGVERFGRYFGRRGLFGFGPPVHTPGPDTGITPIPATGNITHSRSTPSTSPPVTEKGVGGQVEESVQVQGKWQASERGTRILVEVATAYALTKVLLPFRVLVSVWAAPWFARVVLGSVGRLVGWRGRGVSAGNMGRGGGGGGGNVGGISGAAGTGATGGGVIGVGKGKGKKGS